MSAQPDPEAPDLALIVRQPGRPQELLIRYLTLLLNYRYGLELVVVDRFVEAFSAMQRHRERIRCAFVIRNRRVESRASIAPLSPEDEVPLFFLLPRSLIEEHRTLCHRMQNVHFCAWETAFSHTDSALTEVVGSVFAAQGIGDLAREVEGLSPEESERRIEHRLARLQTLPTLPEVALRIMRLVEDPDSTVEELEALLTRDPAVVHRLLQVVGAAAIGGATHRSRWTLHEAIVRLGRKQVGAIALQVKLMNSLVRPEESEFDLGRFWRHSVGTAVVADRLCRGGHLRLPEAIGFDDYWIGALLHDIGKLVLGFFFWPQFAETLAKMDEAGRTFREAETELGDLANHEFLGRVLLQRAKVGKNLVEAVGSHEDPGESPAPLVCLVHVADNLAKGLDLGYRSGEKVVFRASALQTLGLEPGTVDELKASLGPALVTEVDELVERCLGGEK
ncbi:MAG: HDOD domain-containing protein [Candidatus Latescibacterota bacterium]|jgi:HD-like signal output (HDOD) protein